MDESVSSSASVELQPYVHQQNEDSITLDTLALTRTSSTFNPEPSSSPSSSAATAVVPSLISLGIEFKVGKSHLSTQSIVPGIPLVQIDRWVRFSLWLSGKDVLILFFMFAGLTLAMVWSFDGTYHMTNAIIALIHVPTGSLLILSAAHHMERSLVLEVVRSFEFLFCLGNIITFCSTNLVVWLTCDFQMSHGMFVFLVFVWVMELIVEVVSCSMMFMIDSIVSMPHRVKLLLFACVSILLIALLASQRFGGKFHMVKAQDVSVWIYKTDTEALHDASMLNLTIFCVKCVASLCWHRTHSIMIRVPVVIETKST
jgi:hypothetical protein